MNLLHFATWPRWLRDFVPLLLWMGLIFWLSSRSRLVEIESDAGERLFFKSAHIIAYAVLAWLWWRALSATRQFSWGILLAACVLTILYGISDEIHQRFVPGRHGTVHDALFDASGALLMILLLRRISWLRTFPETWLPVKPRSGGKAGPLFAKKIEGNN